MPLEYRSDLIRRYLANLHRSATGVHGVAVITMDGFVIALHPSGWDNNIQDPTGADSVAAMASVVVEQAQKTMTRLAQGAIERILIESEDGMIAVLPITPDTALALLLEKETKLGLTLHLARQAAEGLREILKKEES